jgi:hypothetical protein
MLRFYQFPAFMYSYILLMSVYTVSDGMNYIVADGENSLRQGDRGRPDLLSELVVICGR